MEQKKGDFKYRRINGVTDIRLRDSDTLRRQIIRQWEKLAPLLDDYIPGEPSFDDLKRHGEFRNFVNSLEGESELILFVSARDGENLEKAVGVVDSRGKICAAIHWKAHDESIEFKIFN
jgi:hypothetical protein